MTQRKHLKVEPTCDDLDSSANLNAQGPSTTVSYASNQWVILLMTSRKWILYWRIRSCSMFTNIYVVDLIQKITKCTHAECGSFTPVEFDDELKGYSGQLEVNRSG